MRAVLSGEADGVGGGWVRGFMRQRVAMPAHILLLDAGNPLENEIPVVLMSCPAMTQRHPTGLLHVAAWHADWALDQRHRYQHREASCLQVHRVPRQILERDGWHE